MLIMCTTKGCRQMSEAKLDLKSNDVICEECGNVIENVTPFMKKSLKSIGQVIRYKTKEAFQALCKNCNANRPLTLKDGKAHCKTCDTQVVVSDAFLNGLKIYLDNKTKDSSSEEKAKKTKKKK